MSNLLRKASVRIFSLAFAGFCLYTIFSLATIFFPQDIMEVKLQLAQAKQMTNKPTSASIIPPVFGNAKGNHGVATSGFLKDYDSVGVRSLHIEEAYAFINVKSFQARLALVFPKFLWGLICSYCFLQLYLFLKEIRGHASFSRTQTSRLRNMGIGTLAYVGLQYLCQSLLTPVLIVNMEQTQWPSELMVTTVKKEDYYLWLLGGIVFIYLSLAFKRGELMEEEQKYIL